MGDGCLDRDGDTSVSLREIQDSPGSHNSCLPRDLRCEYVVEALGVFHRIERYKWKRGVGGSAIIRRCFVYAVGSVDVCGYEFY